MVLTRWISCSYKKTKHPTGLFLEGVIFHRAPGGLLHKKQSLERKQTTGGLRVSYYDLLEEKKKKNPQRFWTLGLGVTGGFNGPHVCFDLFTVSLSPSLGLQIKVNPHPHPSIIKDLGWRTECFVWCIISTLYINPMLPNGIYLLGAFPIFWYPSLIIHSSYFALTWEGEWVSGCLQKC